jgi:hypothetical protein
MRAQQILVAIASLALGPLLGLHAAEWKPVSGHIMTEWAEKVDPNSPLPEYPRPQLVRANWVNLNGLWDYAVTPREQTAESGSPNKWDGKILVPFCIESALSGVKRQLLSTERLWYSRSFTAPVLAPGERLLLNFDAVDYEAEVRVNEKIVAMHKGGYDAFSCDITAVIKPGSNTLVVSVLDATGGAQVRGKQSGTAMKRPGGIRYTSTSGIWQTVWLEKVPEHYISKLKIVPDIDSDTVSVTVYALEGDVKVSVLDGAQTLASAEGKSLAPIVLKIPQAKLWSPESPFLYDLDIRLGNDVVKSYFGMRKISVGKDEKGILRPLLNNVYVHFHGPLDQGYWPDGIYTAPTDEALKYDIEMTKKFGFNMTRKHIKVEPARWYYWTDKLGLLVWQDMPSGGAGKGANRQKDGTSISVEDATQFELELHQMIEQHINAPSIVWWIVFNEAWGQYDTPRLTKRVKELDSSRMVCNASGWYDAPSGDVIDEHRYPGPPRPKPTATRIAVNGEFGGVGLAVADHLWVADQTASSMYKTATDSNDYANRFLELWRQVYADDTSLGVSGAVYTQITDIEKEVNGLMTYDRKVVKMDIRRMADAVGKRIFPAELTDTQTMHQPSKKPPERKVKP